MSRRGACWSAAGITLLLLVTVAECSTQHRVGRRLRADPADKPVDPADSLQFQKVTACAPHMKRDATLKELYKGKGFDVVDLTATIEMTETATYANNFRDIDPEEMAPGQTRVNYTVEISPHGGHLPKQLVARLHKGSCFSQLDEDTVYLVDPEKKSSDVESLLNVDEETHKGVSSTVKDYLIDYDQTQAFVVYDGDNQVACCDLIPPFPDFPTEWAATVEANIVNQGYTYVQKETYSEARSMVRIDLHSYDKEIVMVQDYSAKETTIIYPANTTYPHGICTKREFIPSMSNFVNDDAGSIYGTGNFLMFEGKTAEDMPKFDPGHVSVRGIECEAWYRQIKDTKTNSSYDVQFYFPVNQWLVAREDYHRMLKQIGVVGTINGEKVEHLYSYVNFRPYIAPDATFEPCRIAPGGQDCGCEDEDTSVATTEQQITFDENGEGVQIQTVARNVTTASGTIATCRTNDQFNEEQARWYGMWGAVGFVLGMVFLWLCGAIARCCGNRGDRSGHARLRERPFIIGRSQSQHSASSYI